MPDISPKHQYTSGRYYGYIANERNTKLVTYFFGLFAILCVTLPFIGFYTLSVLTKAVREQTVETKQAFLSSSRIYDFISTSVSVVYLICAIIFLFWLYRANSNTHALNKQTKIKFTPSWCIVSYFIPLLDLYWPYESMKELWRLNVGQKGTIIILSWWLSFLIFNFMEFLISDFPVQSYANFYLYVILDAGANIFAIISALLAIKLVIRINQNQVKQQESVRESISN